MHCDYTSASLHIYSLIVLSATVTSLVGTPTLCVWAALIFVQELLSVVFAYPSLPQPSPST